MEGRWTKYLVGGMLAGAIGCASTKNKPFDSPGMYSGTPSATHTAKAPPSSPSSSKKHLSPATYVTMGTLKDDAANEADRPQPERDAFRYQARQSYQKAIEIDSKYIPAYVALAKSYTACDEREKAQATFEKALSVAPKDANLWLEYGAAQARAKDWQAAFESLNRATQLDPENKQAWKLLGFTLARGGRYDDALNTLARVMSEAEARYNLARMMQHNHQTDAAAVQLQQAIAVNPNFEPARLMLAELTQAPAANNGIRQATYQAPVQQSQMDPAAAQQQHAPAQMPAVTAGGRQ